MTPTDTHTVNCPFCRSDAPRAWREAPDRLLHRLDRRWEAVECTHCGVRYTDPRPTPATLGQHYPAAYAPYNPDPKAERKFRLADPRRLAPIDRAFMAERLGYTHYPAPGDPLGRGVFGTPALVTQIPPPFTGSPGHWLDIGCSHGLYLEHLRELGWSVEGLEMDPAAAAYARDRRGIEVREGLFEPGMYGAAAFDGISMWQVLEHVPDPLGSLREMHRMLRPGGVLLIGVPNNAGLMARIAGGYWFPLDLPRHFTHFTPDSLTRFCETAGFRVEQIFHYPSVRDLVRSWAYVLDAWLGPKAGDRLRRWTRHKSFKRIDRKLGPLAARRGHGSRLTLIARKIDPPGPN